MWQIFQRIPEHGGHFYKQLGPKLQNNKHTNFLEVEYITYCLESYMMDSLIHLQHCSANVHKISGNQASWLIHRITLSGWSGWGLHFGAVPWVMKKPNPSDCLKLIQEVLKFWSARIRSLPILSLQKPSNWIQERWCLGDFSFNNKTCLYNCLRNVFYSPVIFWFSLDVS